MPGEHSIFSSALLLIPVLIASNVSGSFIGDHCTVDTTESVDRGRSNLHCIGFKLSSSDIETLDPTFARNLMLENCEINELNGKVVSKLAPELVSLEIDSCNLVITESTERVLKLEKFSSRSNKFSGSKHLTSLLRNFIKLKVFNCVGCHFTKSDPLELRTLQNLRLEHSTIELHENIFAGVYKLEYLHLDSCGISDIPENTFKNLRLTELSLKNNSLKTLKMNIFKGMEDLEHLDLSKNKLTSLCNNLFDDLINLSTLKMDNNQLTTIQANIFKNLKQVTDLSLTGNKLKDLEGGCFNGLISLPNLDLSQNQLEFLAKKTFRGLSSKLSKLNLTGNLLKSLDNKVFENLSGLQNLDLSKNQLTTISSMEVLQFLTVLNVTGNSFQEIDLDGLKRVTVLDLSSNLLRNIKNLHKLRKLGSFLMQNNSLKVTFDSVYDSVPNNTFRGFSNTYFLYDNRFRLTFDSREELRFMPLTIYRIDFSDNEVIICNGCNARTLLQMLKHDNTKFLSSEKECIQDYKLICDSVKIVVEWS